MTTAPVDPRFALDAANASDMVQKKVAIDAMKKRVSGGASEEKKLRDACEGFESVFLQKMWEQMRKNVKKEGYLHSKDEESYQSMFDTELSKKMASAGGIGLADMMYEQLSQKLTNTSKTTGAGAMRVPLPIEPARSPKPEPEVAAQNTSAPADLYSEMEEGEAKPQANPLADALTDLAASRDPAQDPANATYPMFDLQNGTPMNVVAERQKEESEPRREFMVTPLPERVSPPSKARPSNALNGVGRSSRHARKKAPQDAGAAEAAERTNFRRTRGNERANASHAAPAESAGISANANDGTAAAPVAPPAPAAEQRAGSPETHDWATSGDMVSSYKNQARSLQDSGRAPWSKIA